MSVALFEKLIHLLEQEQEQNETAFIASFSPTATRLHEITQQTADLVETLNEADLENFQKQCVSLLSKPHETLSRQLLLQPPF